MEALGRLSAVEGRNAAILSHPDLLSEKDIFLKRTFPFRIRSSLASSCGGRAFRARASVQLAFVCDPRSAKPERVISLAKQNKKKNLIRIFERAENLTSFRTGKRDRLSLGALGAEGLYNK